MGEANYAWEVPKNLNELIAWTQSHQGKKLIRYTSTSAISTVVSFIALYVLYYHHVIKGEVIATVVANLVASLPSYWLNRRWAWGKSGRSHFRKEIVPFWSMSLLGTSFSIIGAYIVKHFSKAGHWSHPKTTALLLFANVMSFGIFWVLKMLAFNRMFKVDELEEFDEHLTMEERSTGGARPEVSP